MAEGDCQTCPPEEDIPTSTSRDDDSCMGGKAEVYAARAHMRVVWHMLNDALDLTQPYTDARQEVNQARGTLREINTRLGSDLRRMLAKSRQEGWTREDIVAAELGIWKAYEGPIQSMTKAPEKVYKLVTQGREKSDDENATGDDYDESAALPPGALPDEQSPVKTESNAADDRDE